MSWTTMAAALLASLALAAPALAADGDLDTTYGGGDGLASTLHDGETSQIAVQPDGKVVVANTTPGGDVGGSLTRLTTSGEPDPTFGGDGDIPAGISGDIDDVAVQPDGRILFTGTEHPLETGEVAVFRLNADGSRDLTFGGGDGKAVFDFTDGHSSPRRLFVQPDGRIVVVGSGPSYNFDAARLTSAGILDSTFSGDGRVSEDLGGDREFARDVTLQGSRLVIVGSSNFERTENTDTSRFAALALTATGARDGSFGASGNGVVGVEFSGLSSAGHVTNAPDGGLVLAGSAAGTWALAKLDAAGRPQTGFSGDGRLVLDVAGGIAGAVTTADGNIAVAGGSGNAVVAKVTQAGQIEPSFGNGGTRTYGPWRGLDLARQADGKLLFAVQPPGDATHVARILDAPPPVEPEPEPEPQPQPRPSLPVLNLTGGSTPEGQVLVFTATLSRPTDMPVTVDYITGEGTAATGLDFGGRRGTVTIPPGQTSAPIAVATNADRFFEPPEDFRVELYEPANARFGEYVAFGTIVNVLRSGRCQNIVLGNRRGDILTGSAAGDLIIGRADSDVLFGLDGPDCISGERGHDIIDAGDGDDLVDGGSGDDEMKGGDGNDRLIGRRGLNRYNGGPGNDRIYARNGRREIVECGAGRDTVKADRGDRLRRCERVSR